jgi:protein gp37
MSEHSSIEWTDATFNPWRGCTKVSPGCTNCYAERLSLRNPDVLGIWGDNGKRAIASESYWRQPLQWDAVARAAGIRKRVFCASLADVFEQRPELEQPRARLLGLVAATPRLDWLLLTKRPEAAAAYFSKRSRMFEAAKEFVDLIYGKNSGTLVGDGFHAWPPENVWCGVSVEDRRHGKPRIELLRQILAAVRFLSIEPLIEDLGELDLRGIHWVIVGGESGPGSRPMNPEWVRSIRDQCVAKNVPFFFKQWGHWVPLGPTSGLDPDHFYPGGGKRQSVPSGVPMSEPTSMFPLGKKIAGRLLDGRTWDQMPGRAEPCSTPG